MKFYRNFADILENDKMLKNSFNIEFPNFLNFLAKIPKFCRNFHRTLIAIVRSVRSLADRTLQLRKEAVALRVPDTCLTLLAMDEARQQETIPLGEAYVDFYATFQVDLNAQVLGAIPPKDRKHAIDGKHALLLDCRHLS